MEAVRAYQALGDLLWRELRVKPSAELTDLVHNLGGLIALVRRALDAI